MRDELREVIRGLPKDAFREPEGRFASLSPLERLRWLQQTAHFVWKFKGVARRPRQAETNVTTEPGTARAES